ncbi:hypothetical protein I3842_13G117800 [Carya illinoinensis]|uniref:Uncharacterized protein n=1 Tax=Carya illinoinensis TaxID=32201 RepID=A0A922AJW1_CARIL|nr:hypothetical protein I3842_13G117800 [Carya illinoinensis]
MCIEAFWVLILLFMVIELKITMNCQSIWKGLYPLIGRLNEFYIEKFAMEIINYH